MNSTKTTALRPTHSFRIAFFDIDGTLLNFGARDLNPPVLEALLALRRQGVKLYAATGRPPYTVPHFKGFEFDGKLCFNGSYCLEGDKLIYSCPLDREELAKVVENATRMGIATEIATASWMGCNFYQKELDDYMYLSKHHLQILEDFERLLGEADIYQMMVGCTAELDEALLTGTKDVKVARWLDSAADIIPRSCGKAYGIEKILDYYGWDRKECIAFGDGGNDLDMIAYAGLGVAMGNASEAVKAVADYVTDPCEADGVYTALLKLGLL